MNDDESPVYFYLVTLAHGALLGIYDDEEIATKAAAAVYGVVCVLPVKRDFR